MASTRPALLCVVLALVSVQLVSGAQPWCEQVPSAAHFDKSLSQLYACSSVPPFMLAHMWSPVQITIQCPSTWFSVYKGDSEALLRKNIKDRSTAFCGLERFLDGRTCRFQMSPFWPTYVGIKDGSSACKMEAKVEFSLPMMLSAVAGVALFYLAPGLTSSVFFRLGCGSMLFTTGSLIILIFILMRNVPYKRTAGIALGCMGTTGMALVRWLTGQWLPSWSQLSQNPLFQGYVLASAVVGAALTYWFDDPRSPKLNTLILMALRTLGLALVYYGTWVMPVAFAGVSGVLLTSLISPQLQDNMEQTRVHVRRVTSATAAIIMSPFNKTPRTGPGDGATPRGSGFSFWGGSGPAWHKQAQLRELEEQRRRRALLGLPVHDDPDINDLVPMHLKTPPPDPWSLACKQADVQHVSSFEEKYSEALRKQQQRSSGVSRRRGSPAAGSAGPPGSSGAAASGSREQQLALGDYIFNPSSGRKIKIGGDTFMRLVDEGWTPDLKAGLMVPPRSDSGAARGEGSGKERERGAQARARSQRS